MTESSGAVRVVRAGSADIDRLALLFDAYRRFYNQPANLEAARAFLAGRVGQNESTVFIAEEDGVSLGFVQLYPTFSSVEMARWWILNDLYVIPEARGKGLASLLLERARTTAVETGAGGLSLETARSNSAAQKLYEGKGWKRDDVFLHYELRV